MNRPIQQISDWERPHRVRLLKTIAAWNVPNNSSKERSRWRVSQFWNSLVIQKRGVHAFWPLFQIFSLFPKIFHSPWKILPIFPLPLNIFCFYPPKFLITNLELMTKKGNFPPHFHKFFLHFPCFRKRSFPPTLTISPLFRLLYVFLPNLRVYFFPQLWPWCIYASYNTRIGRPWSRL